MPQPRGPFITLEGVDGAGKSSHGAAIESALRAAGLDVVFTKEPGGTPLSERLRIEIKQTPMSPQTEAFLAFAARTEHLAQVIRPGLAEGKAVVSDRFTDSTFAYQGSGNGYSWESLLRLEAEAHGDLQPDLTLLFDLPTHQAEGRRNQRQASSGEGESKDKFDVQQGEFFERVRAGYQARVKADPQRFVVIDASQSLDAVRDQVAQALATFTATWSPPRPEVPRRKP